MLLVLSLTFPKDGIELSKDVTLLFPEFNSWLAAGIKKQPKNDSVLNLVDNDLSIIEEDTMKYVESEMVDSSVFEFKPRAIMTDSIRHPLELPSSGLACLEGLFQALTNPDELKRIVRIMHYGDSQIETDRITGYLRYKLQQQFGGSGPGLIPAKTAYDYTSPCKVVNFGDWKRYTIFPKIDTAVGHSRYGVLAAFSMFGPLRPKKVETPQVVPDSVAFEDSILVMNKLAESIQPEEPKQVHTGVVQFIPSSVSRSNVKTIKKCRLIYGNTDQECDVQVFDGDNLLFTDNLKPSEFYTTRLWNFSETPANLKIEFSSTQSPEIYGFAMDGLSGIAVDNIALRGCSGTIFTKMNGKMLAQMYNEFNVKCLILQFGGNAVPSLNPDNVGNFVSAFASQIRYIKKLCPKMSIIVVGPADMSKKVQDQYETYEVLPILVEKMKVSALNNGCAFWDMYAAMGGKNTMPDWVYHEPALAEKDFVHFTPNGANVMARMLYSAIIARYNQFIKK